MFGMVDLGVFFSEEREGLSRDAGVVSAASLSLIGSLTKKEVLGNSSSPTLEKPRSELSFASSDTDEPIVLEPQKRITDSLSSESLRVSPVLVNCSAPVLKSQNNIKKRSYKFYIISIPFITTDLLANGTARARSFYSRRRTLNEDLGEMWIHRGLERMTYEEGHTTDPNEADVFFIPGYNNFRFSIHKWDFPRGKELDKMLLPHIFNKTKPHFIATPRVRNRIGINHMVSSLKRLGVNLHSLGYERNVGWQSVSLDRIVTVPYVVSPKQSKAELQKTLREIPRSQNFTFFAGDNRPLAHRFGGCDRENIVKHVTGQRHGMSISLFWNKKDRLSQAEYNHRMQTSEYCLVLCGDSPTSRSLASSMLAGCIPIIVGSRWRGLCEGPCHSGWGWDIANLSHLPYPHLINWGVFPEVNEAEFSKDPESILREVFRRQSPRRRDELRAAMGEIQMVWVYGWGNPIDSEEFGNAVPTIWKAVINHLENFQS
jgi:hypothetical protein